MERGFKHERNIQTVAFEGIHGSGKGTQIDLLKKSLGEKDIPFCVVKGEGYRFGAGEMDHDPYSEYWDKMSQMIRSDGKNFQHWDESSHRLAREFFVWRDRVLRSKIDESLDSHGILLLDRSVVSRALLLRAFGIAPENQELKIEDLLPALRSGKDLSIEDVLPDVIIELVAPEEVLLSRLDSDDPDYDFRSHNIKSSFELLKNIRETLPPEIKERVVTIDSNQDVELVEKEIASALLDNDFNI